MAKNKRKLTPAEKAEKKRRREQYMTIFVNGKQKRVKRPPTIDGMDVDEFIRRNADPIWLHQNEMWEYMEPEPEDEYEAKDEDETKTDKSLDIPF
jgi:hypothetical protein